MIVVDNTGMPQPPTIRQLMNKDLKQLYTRDTTPDKSKYMAEAIIIYYLGDPKSPAKQAGLSDAEALKMAIEQAGLNKDYIPDKLVINLIKQYYEENITEAGRTVENLNQSIHLVNLSINSMNNILNEKLHSGITIDEIQSVMTILNSVKDVAKDIPSIIKKLKEAQENLMYEKETELARGGSQVLSSMDADDYE